MKFASSYLQGHHSHSVMIDIFANLIGKGWVALVSVLFVPFFIKLMGVEAYGVVGLYITLQTVLLLLDFGFSTTLNRSIAACGKGVISPEVVSLATVLERLFLGFAVLILLFVIISASWIANNWISYNELDSSNVELGLQMMGWAIGMQLPVMLYNGGLIGLKKQVCVNIILASFTTLRFGGAILILLSISSTIQAFFVWQAVISTFQMLSTRYIFFKLLRTRSDSIIDTGGILKKHFGFATAIGLTAILGVVLTQLDKLMLSKLLPMEEYGYYVMAWTLSAILLMLANPVVTAYFPRFSEQAAIERKNSVEQYHNGCQLLSVAVMPAAALLIIFPSEILMLWIGNLEVVSNVRMLVVLLSIGSLLNTLVQVPHAMQLACGFPRLGLYANILLVFISVPTIWLCVKYAGVHGAALVWIFLNASYVIIGVPLMHKWIMQGQFFFWLKKDIIIPMFTAFSVLMAARLIFTFQIEQSIKNFTLIITCYLVAILACMIVTPKTAEYLSNWRIKLSRSNK